jgi:hypothetical protein
MSAERGWIGEPQPAREWHTPGWVKEGGRHFVTPPGARRIAARDGGTATVPDAETRH